MGGENGDKTSMTQQAAYTGAHAIPKCLPHIRQSACVLKAQGMVYTAHRIPNTKSVVDATL